MTSIFSEIRAASEAVAQSARWVQVDEIGINEYPEKILMQEKIVLEHTAEHHLLGKGDDTLRFFVILDTINFGSGYFPFLDKDRDVSGYFTVARRLKTHCEREGIPTAETLSSLNAEKCASIFQQEIDNLHMAELMQLFTIALRDLGEWATNNYGGDLIGFLRNADTAEVAIRSLMEMNGFNDVANYYGMRVPLLKRAQILLQDIKLAEPNHQLINFDDIDSLTVFADNVLPYVLECDGILKYDEWLSGRISREEIIGSGSAEEIELRACSVYAAERICDIIRTDLKEVSVRELDYMLWNRGQKLKKAIDRKRHRTRCMYY